MVLAVDFQLVSAGFNACGAGALLRSGHQNPQISTDLANLSGKKWPKVQKMRRMAHFLAMERADRRRFGVTAELCGE